MIDLALKLVDHVIRLLKERRTHKQDVAERRRHFVQEVLDPLFQDVETIAKDYVAIFGTVRRGLSDPRQTKETITNELRHLRSGFEPIRIKVRSLAVALKSEFDEKEDTQKHVVPGEIFEFAWSIGALLGSTAYHGYRNFEIPDPVSNVVPNTSVTHMLFYTLENMKNRSYTEQQTDEVQWRRDGIDNVDALTGEILFRWGRVTDRYARARLSLLLD